jgi:hypothetical protein
MMEGAQLNPGKLMQPTQASALAPAKPLSALDTLEAWRPAVTWGVGVALVHRLVLSVWMAVIWVSIGAQADVPAKLHVDPIAHLPALNSTLEQSTLGVWRRWDASHYLNLAQNGYRASDPGPTVFGPLTPFSIRFLDALLPGDVDTAGVLFGTLAFALVLILVYRLCERIYGDARLGKAALMVMALLPISFFYQAPMSEALYLALVLGVFYAASSENWWMAGVLGGLAVLARSQGILLAGVAGLMLLQSGMKRALTWAERVRYIARKALPLALIPLALAGFLAFRQSQGLPALDIIYHDRSYVFFVNPLQGLWLNVQWIIANPGAALFNIDIWALGITLVLAVWLLNLRRTYKLPLVAYTWVSIGVLLSKVNWDWGGHEVVLYTQSYARYSLSLFPLALLAAEYLNRSPRRRQLAAGALSLAGLLFFSALFTLGLGPP